MDVETASAIVRLRERVDTLDTSLRQGIADLRIELRNGLAELHDGLAEVRDGLVEVRDGLVEGREELVEVREGLLEGREGLAEVREGLAQSRRHAVMLNESTREDIRFVAEAVANLTVKIDSLRR